MPRRTTAAKRYADAIAGLARETGSWEQWRQDLHRVGQAMEDPVVRLYVESPTVTVERKQLLLEQAMGAPPDEAVRNLIALMARRGRLELVPDLVSWFDELADRALGVLHITVTSAAPLTNQQRQQLKERLAAGTSPEKVHLTERVDPEILGGLIVQQEDIISDYSVRARLESLRDRMN